MYFNRKWKFFYFLAQQQVKTVISENMNKLICITAHILVTSKTNYFLHCQRNATALIWGTKHGISNKQQVEAAGSCRRCGISGEEETRGLLCFVLSHLGAGSTELHFHPQLHTQGTTFQLHWLVLTVGMCCAYVRLCVCVSGQTGMPRSFCSCQLLWCFFDILIVRVVVCTVSKSEYTLHIYYSVVSVQLV